MCIRDSFSGDSYEWPGKPWGYYSIPDKSVFYNNVHSQEYGLD